MSHQANETDIAASSTKPRTVVLKPTCIHLRHKLMYCDERQATPGLVDDSSDTRIFQCMQSHECFGPDEQGVNPSDCQPSRTCFEPVLSIGTTRSTSSSSTQQL